MMTTGYQLRTTRFVWLLLILSVIAGSLTMPALAASAETIPAVQTAGTIPLADLRQLVWNATFFGVLLTVGLLHMLYFLGRRQEYAPLYFGLFCLLLALQIFICEITLLRTALPQITQETALLLENSLSLAGVTCYAAFLHAVYPNTINSKAYQTAIGICLLQGLFFIATPAWFFPRIYLADQLFFLLLFLYLSRQMVGLLRRQRLAALFPLLGAVVLIGCSLNDIGYYLGLVATERLVSSGLLILAFCHTALVAKQFFSTFTQLRSLNNQLTSMSKWKNDFMAHATHELLTPVHGVTDLLKSVTNTSCARLTDAEAEMLHTALSINQQLANLVNNLHDYLEIKYGKIILRYESVNLRNVAELAVTKIQLLAKEKDLTVVNQIPVDYFIITDVGRFQQILFNLLENIVRHTHSGRILVGATQQGYLTKVMLEEVHTADGPPADLPRLRPGSGQSSFSSASLGLSIAEKLLELHSSRLQIDRNATKGIRCSFTLPAAEAKDSPRQISDNLPDIPRRPPETKPALQNAGTILLVDNDPATLKILQTHLAPAGYVIFRAFTGQQALRLIKPGQFDLVILDIRITDASGYDICRSIRSQYTLAELPVLILTVKNRTDDIVVALTAGANDYLAKPFDSQELIARVNTLVLMKKSMREALENQQNFLLAQIKPHFLYNVLNTIMGLCIIDPNQAYTLLSELSTFLRSRFRFDSANELIRLAAEINAVQSYLKIEQARFGERLHFDIRVPIGQDLLLPPLIIQPLVENAVRHGICKKKRGGRLRVAATDDGEYIKIRIVDGGVGMTPNLVKDILADGGSPAGGLGVRNVQTRLRLYFGEGLHIRSIPGLGTCVWFRLPRLAEAEGGDSYVGHHSCR